MALKNQLHTQLSTIITDTLSKCAPNLNKWRSNFIFETLLLFLSVSGRICFLQLGRYSQRCEQSFRQQFEKKFNFMCFNSQLVNDNFSIHRAIAIDPSYIPKSGKKTPYIGSFWSGCAKSIKRGLEVMGIAVIDIIKHQALHLEAVHTPPAKTLKVTIQSLSDWYLYVINEKKEELSLISNYIVADAFFSKLPFVSGLREMGFHLISRLQSNAAMRYIHIDEQKPGRGRPKKHGSKVDIDNPDLSVFTAFQYKGNTCYHAIVYSIALKINILAIIEHTTDKNKAIKRIIFSTNTESIPESVLDTYHARFLIEFQFRDAKQAVGLTHCQARSLNKLHSHINFALTAVNIAKIAHWNDPLKKDMPFSIADTKIMMHNQLMINLFFRKFGIDPNTKKNNKIAQELLIYGTKAA